MTYRTSRTVSSGGPDQPWDARRGAHERESILADRVRAGA